MNFILSLPLILLLDRIFAEPKRFHPLVGFGKLANFIEAKFNCGRAQFARGVTAWCVAVIPITVFVLIVDMLIGSIWISVVCGWLAIGWQSLREHGAAVFNALQNNDIKQARLKTAHLVSRDTSNLNESDLSKATIESILENGSDAIIAPLFWLMIFGASGVVFYRLCNTLDAMWGYRNQRFEHFGKFTARMDDVLNYFPARITAFLYVLVGSSKQALQAWLSQANKWYSPNAGVVMAAGAGALQLGLGGDAIYQGKDKQRPELGSGESPRANDIKRTIRLLDRSVYVVLFITIFILSVLGAWLLIFASIVY